MISHMRSLGIGIDAGGTSTRWAVCDPSGQMLGEGEVGGLTGLMLLTLEGRAELARTLYLLAPQVKKITHSAPCRLYAGFTGRDGDMNDLTKILSDALSVDLSSTVIVGDVELAYRAVLAPAAGYLVYAGTGSIAAYIDDAGALQRAGGRGVLLDDGGGGYWIAREALRAIWRSEDQRPGSWRESALAREVFARIGGDDWSVSRTYFYSSSRGEIGRLALAVAKAAAEDPQAMNILRDAGIELARLANAMLSRYGERAITLSGRAATLLHPAIVESMREHVARHIAIRSPENQSAAHHAAARLAINLNPLS